MYFIPVPVSMHQCDKADIHKETCSRNRFATGARSLNVNQFDSMEQYSGAQQFSPHKTVFICTDEEALPMEHVAQACCRSVLQKRVAEPSFLVCIPSKRHLYARGFFFFFFFDDIISLDNKSSRAN